MIGLAGRIGWGRELIFHPRGFKVPLLRQQFSFEDAAGTRTAAACILLTD
jgi:hypothetical protein